MSENTEAGSNWIPPTKEECVEILCSGPKGIIEWNALRKAHPGWYPELINTNFSYQNFKGANLESVNLRRSSLIGANLEDVNFYDAELDNAYLAQAYLLGTGLSYTSLRKTDLSEAILYNAVLDDAQFEETNFSHTVLYETVFKNIDLSKAMGLETCIFEGPCTIDHRTLERSVPFSISFMRGCGLSDKFIKYIPSIFSRDANQLYSCFISYSNLDEDFANRIYSDLQNEGVRCWFAPEDLKIGDRFRQEIDSAIRRHDKLLIIISENSINSDWVESEVENALERERKEKTTVLFPIQIDDAITKSDKAWAGEIRRTRHIGNFSNWKDHDSYTEAFKCLLRDLRSEEPPTVSIEVPSSESTSLKQ